MLLKLTLRRTGNSIGLVLPKEALDHLGAGEGDAVFLTFLGSNGLVFTGNELPVVETMVELAQGQDSEAGFAHYLRCNCEAV